MGPVTPLYFCEQTCYLCLLEHLHAQLPHVLNGRPILPDYRFLHLLGRVLAFRRPTFREARAHERGALCDRY